MRPTPRLFSALHRAALPAATCALILARCREREPVARDVVRAAFQNRHLTSDWLPWSDRHRLTIDGTMPDGSLAAGGGRAPWFVFDPDRQDWTAGPFPTRAGAAAALARLAGRPVPPLSPVPSPVLPPSPIAGVDA